MSSFSTLHTVGKRNYQSLPLYLAARNFTVYALLQFCTEATLFTYTCQQSLLPHSNLLTFRTPAPTI